MKTLMIRTTLMFGLTALLLACNNTAPKHSDSSTSGNITVTVDESLKPIIEAEREVFEALYPNAKLNMVYTNEHDAIRMVMQDSARIAIVTRNLLAEETQPFEKRKITPRNIVIGYDAIGIIMNRARKDTILNVSQLAGILNGTYKTWKDLDKANAADPIKVVFDDGKSGAVRHLRDSLLNGGELARHCYAVNSNPEVISQVEKDKDAIGIIGVSWISDKDDTTSNNFVKKIRVVSLVPKDPQTAEAPVMKPYQAYIALKQYPLYRSITIINPEGRYGLGTGFASFINSDKGQRIILKSGLVPANAPVRIIQLNND
jgi:phosphate transport system substrate-binding protein